MKLFSSLIVVYFLGISLFAQNIEVTYKVSVNTIDPLLKTISTYKLQISGNEALYYNPVADGSELLVEPYNVIRKSPTRVRAYINESTQQDISNDYFYKNYVTDSIVFEQTIQGKTVVVYEPNKVMDWEIDNDFDTLIMSQQCYKATASFRGRDYVAFFSPTANANGAPWKFDGLPGLVLAAHSTDNYLSIVPTSIKLNAGVPAVKNPYHGAEMVYTWDGYVKDLEEKLRRTARKYGVRIRITDKIEDMGFGVIE